MIPNRRELSFLVVAAGCAAVAGAAGSWQLSALEARRGDSSAGAVAVAAAVAALAGLAAAEVLFGRPRLRGGRPRFRLRPGLAVLALAVFGWANVSGRAGPPVVVVVNDSAHALSAVELAGEGAGWTASVPDLAPGEARSLVVPHGGAEGSLSLRFEAAGREHHRRHVGYLDAPGLFALAVRVEEDLDVGPAHELDWHWRRL